MNKSELEKLARAKKETQRKLVLVVEDNPTQRQLYVLIAEHVGMIAHIVETCDEGMEAITLIDFDLVIIDLKMPSISGIECAKKMQDLSRKRNARTHMIAVTARAMHGDRESCLAAGMDDYLSKPFTLEQLREKISIWAA